MSSVYVHVASDPQLAQTPKTLHLRSVQEGLSQGIEADGKVNIVVRSGREGGGLRLEGRGRETVGFPVRLDASRTLWRKEGGHALRQMGAIYMYLFYTQKGNLDKQNQK